MNWNSLSSLRRVGGIVFLLALPLSAAEFWVSPTGNDANPGTPDQPLASPALALRKARDLRRLSPTPPEGGVQVLLRGGTYRLDQTLVVRPEDSGTASSPTTLAAAPGERPVLSGGVVLGGWQRLATDVPGLPAAARGQVWVAEIPLFNGRTLEFRQLWIDNRKAVRARTPNDGTMERLTAWDRTQQEAGFPAALVDALAAPADLSGKTPDVTRAFRPPAGLELIVAQQWEIAVLRVRELRREGAEARVRFHQPESGIEFEHPWPQPILQSEGGSGAFFLANALSFLDSPGEWFADTAGGRVYYWPRAGEDLTRAAVIAPAVETLLEIAGSLDRPVTHLTVRGLAFAHTTWLRPSLLGHVPLQAGMFITEAYKIRPPGTPDWRSLDNQTWTGRAPAGVIVTAATQLRLEGCRFEHMAMSGLDLGPGTRDSTVEGCVFRDLGNNGVQFGSFNGGAIESHLPYQPADEREICTRVRIANNVVYDAANEDWGGVGIIAGFVREATIEHNDISEVSYTGISLGWGWTRTPNAMHSNRVHANRLHRIATRMCDNAGIYTLSAQPGTVVDENCIEEIRMSPWVDRPDHWFYLYTDEGSSFITVRDNWCPEEKFLQNATGPGNVWERNGPMVPAAIKDAAGLEPAYRELLKSVQP